MSIDIRPIRNPENPSHTVKAQPLPEITETKTDCQEQIQELNPADLLPPNTAELQSIADYNPPIIAFAVSIPLDKEEQLNQQLQDLRGAISTSQLPDTIKDGQLQSRTIILVPAGQTQTITKINAILNGTSHQKITQGLFTISGRIFGQAGQAPRITPVKPQEETKQRPLEAINGCAKFYGKINLGKINSKAEGEQLNQILKLAHQHRIFIGRTGRDTSENVVIEFLLVDEKPAEAIAFLDTLQQTAAREWQTSISAALTYTQAQIEDRYTDQPLNSPEARTALAQAPVKPNTIYLDDKTALLAKDIRALRARAEVEETQHPNFQRLVKVEHFPNNFEPLEGTLHNPAHLELQQAIAGNDSKTIAVIGPAGSGKSTAIRYILPEDRTSRVNGLTERDELAPFERMVRQLVTTISAINKTQYKASVTNAFLYLQGFINRQSPSSTFTFDEQKLARSILIAKKLEAMAKEAKSFLYFDDPDRLSPAGRKLFRRIQNEAQSSSRNLMVDIVYSQRDDIAATEDVVPDISETRIKVTPTTILDNDTKVENIDKMITGVIKRYRLARKITGAGITHANTAFTTDIEVIKQAGTIAQMDNETAGNLTGSPHNFAIAIEILAELGTLQAIQTEEGYHIILDKTALEQQQDKISQLASQGDIYSSQLSLIDTPGHHYEQVIHLGLLCNGMSESLFTALLDEAQLASYLEITHREIITVQDGAIHVSNKWNAAINQAADHTLQAEQNFASALQERWQQNEASDLCLLFELATKHNLEILRNNNFLTAATEEAISNNRHRIAHEIAQGLHGDSPQAQIHAHYLKLKAATLAGKAEEAEETFKHLAANQATLRAHLTTEQQHQAFSHYLQALAQKARTDKDTKEQYRRILSRIPDNTSNQNLNNLKQAHQINLETLDAVQNPSPDKFVQEEMAALAIPAGMTLKEYLKYIKHELQREKLLRPIGKMEACLARMEANPETTPAALSQKRQQLQETKANIAQLESLIDKVSQLIQKGLQQPIIETIQKAQKTIQAIEANTAIPEMATKNLLLGLHINLQTLANELARYLSEEGEDFQLLQLKAINKEPQTTAALQHGHRHGVAARKLLVETGGFGIGLATEAQIDLHLSFNLIRYSQSPKAIEQALNRFSASNENIDIGTQIINLLQISSTLEARLSADSWLQSEDETAQKALQIIRQYYYTFSEKAYNLTESPDIKTPEGYEVYTRYNQAEMKARQAIALHNTKPEAAQTAITEAVSIFEQLPPAEDLTKAITQLAVELAYLHQLINSTKINLPIIAQMHLTTSDKPQAKNDTERQLLEGTYHGKPQNEHQLFALGRNYKRRLIEQAYNI